MVGYSDCSAMDFILILDPIRADEGRSNDRSDMTRCACADICGHFLSFALFFEVNHVLVVEACHIMQSSVAVLSRGVR